MAVTKSTIKRLFAKSRNKCAMPTCGSPLVSGESVIGEICHICARKKGGPRYDPSMTAAERNDERNLLLLCGVCHTKVDTNVTEFTVGKLAEMKRSHEALGTPETSAKTDEDALKILAKHLAANSARAIAANGSTAIAIAGNNHGPINIHLAERMNYESAGNSPESKSPAIIPHGQKFYFNASPSPPLDLDELKATACYTRLSAREFVLDLQVTGALYKTLKLTFRAVSIPKKVGMDTRVEFKSFDVELRLGYNPERVEHGDEACKTFERIFGHPPVEPELPPSINEVYQPSTSKRREVW